MILLPHTITRKGIRYVQLARSSDTALYSGQYTGDTWTDKPTLWFEAFTIPVRATYEVGGKTIEEHEYYPSDEMFGKSAKSFFGAGALEKAYDYLANITHDWPLVFTPAIDHFTNDRVEGCQDTTQREIV